jgi:hypothetical protein
LLAALTPEYQSLLAPHLKELWLDLGFHLQEAGEPVDAIHLVKMDCDQLVSGNAILFVSGEKMPGRERCAGRAASSNGNRSDKDGRCRQLRAYLEFRSSSSILAHGPVMHTGELSQ